MSQKSILHLDAERHLIRECNGDVGVVVENRSAGGVPGYDNKVRVRKEDLVKTALFLLGHADPDDLKACSDSIELKVPKFLSAVLPPQPIRGAKRHVAVID